MTDEVSGEPIHGAQIDRMVPRWTAVTDSAGRFRFEVPYDGSRLTLSAASTGFLAETRIQQIPCSLFVIRPGEVPACRVEFDFELRRAEPLESASPRCTIRGSVVLRDTQTPVESALVEVDGTGLVTQTGRDGVYALAGVPAGLHGVTANSIGNFPLSRLVVVSCSRPGEGPTLPMRLSPYWIG